MEGRKVPGIRFEGFEEEWEQRKLGNVTVKIGSGKTPSGGNNAYVDFGITLIRSQNINDNKVNLLDAVNIDVKTDSAMKNSQVYKNDVLLNITGASIGRSAVYKGIEHANVNQHVCIIRPNEGYFSEFIQLNLASNNGQRQIETSQAGGGREGLNFQQIGKMCFMFPSMAEQIKIGEYFSALDHLITLHQRKYKRLKLFKESMLNKMFPKDSEKIPEIRFEGFSNDWKQHKLGKIASKITMKNTGSQYIETFTNSAEFGIISQRDFFDHNVSNIENIEGYYVVEDDVFVYNPRISTSAPVGPINRNKLGRTGVVSPLYTVFKTHDIDSEYLEWYFKSNHWHLFMYFNGDTGARSDRFSIKDSVFFEMPIPIPDIDEQIKIGKYLSKLDSLITLQQYKMETLQNFKKSLLEKMFT
jgi:type I restriction enzyme S subunit